MPVLAPKLEILRTSSSAPQMVAGARSDIFFLIRSISRGAMSLTNLSPRTGFTCLLYLSWSKWPDLLSPPRCLKYSTETSSRVLFRLLFPDLLVGLHLLAMPGLLDPLREQFRGHLGSVSFRFPANLFPFQLAVNLEAYMIADIIPPKVLICPS